MENKKEFKVLWLTREEWLLETIEMNQEKKGVFLTLLIIQSQYGYISENKFDIVVGGFKCSLGNLFRLENGNYYYEDLRQRVARLTTYPITRISRNEIEVTGTNSVNNILFKSKKREVKPMPMPELSVFLDYCKTLIPDSYDIIKQSLELKYIAWKESGWKNGHDKEIKNWKSAIANTIPYLNKVRSVPTSKINNIINETNKLLAQNGITNTDYIPKGWD